MRYVFILSFGCLVFLGCSKDTQENEDNSAFNVEDFKGSWGGGFKKTNEDLRPFEIILSTVELNKKCGELALIPPIGSTRHCVFDMTLIKQENAVLSFNEKLVLSEVNNCDEGKSEISLISKDRISYKWTSLDNSLSASGTLNRRK